LASRPSLFKMARQGRLATDKTIQLTWYFYDKTAISMLQNAKSYTDAFDEKTDIPAMFDAAHLYRIKGLVLRCENILTNALAIENAAEFFYKGYLTGSIHLKTAAMNFIAENFKLVKETGGWSNFLMSSNSPKAMEEILGFAMRKKNSYITNTVRLIVLHSGG
jgi:hypothetical protein